MSDALLTWTRLNAPAILAFAPLAAAALLVLSPSQWMRATIGLSVLAGCAVLGVDMAVRAILIGASPYTLGAIEAPFGVVLQSDGLSALAAGAMAVFAAIGWMAGLNQLRRVTTIECAAVLICIGALQCAVLSHDFLTIFLALQCAGLSCVVAAAIRPDDRRVLPAAFLALVSFGFAGALYLSGLALTRETLGGLGIDAGASAIATRPANVAMVAGLLLLIGGALCWAAATPSSSWAPTLFGRGSNFSALALASLFGLATFVVLTRLYALAMAQPANQGAFALFMGLAGAATVIVASLRAASAQCVRRLAGYAIGVQMGGALIGLALGGAGAAAGLLHVVHAGAIGLALHAAGTLFRDPQRSSTPITRLDGAGQRAPIVAACVTIALLALVAAPATAPFLSKWLILEASLEAGWGWAAGALVFGSLAAVLVTGRVIERMYFRAGESAPGALRPRESALTAGAVLTAAWLVYCGIEGAAPLATAQAVILPLFAGVGGP